AAALCISIICSATGHREIEVAPWQLAHVRRTFSGEPSVQRFDDARAELGPLHHAAVEEDGGRMEERRVVRAREALQILGRRSLLAEEGREVPGNRRVAGVRKA